MRPVRIVPLAAFQTPDNRHARIFTLSQAKRQRPDKFSGGNFSKIARGDYEREISPPILPHATPSMSMSVSQIVGEGVARRVPVEAFGAFHQDEGGFADFRDEARHFVEFEAIDCAFATDPQRVDLGCQQPQFQIAQGHSPKEEGKQKNIPGLAA
jgi:hypothetical protein